jgi:hypothetical protein
MSRVAGQTQPRLTVDRYYAVRQYYLTTPYVAPPPGLSQTSFFVSSNLQQTHVNQPITKIIKTFAMSSSTLLKIAAGILLITPIGHTRMYFDEMSRDLGTLGPSLGAFASKVSWHQANGYFITTGITSSPSPGLSFFSRKGDRRTAD